MTIRVPRSRKFPSRISQEDLKAKTTAVFKEVGANNHFQAQFYEATSREVIGSNNFRFSTLQPKLKIGGEKEAWQMAYDFIFDFLQKNKMDLTLSTMNTEFLHEGKKPVLTNLFDDIDRNNFFEDLKDQAENSSSFSNHVSDWAKEEGI